MRVEHTDLYRPRADGNEHEDEHGTIRDGDGVRVPLLLTDGTRATATLAERRAFGVPAEMSDADAAHYISGYKMATGTTAQFDGSLQRPGYRFSHMIDASLQVRDGVSLADAERARNAAFQEKIRRDANAWRRPAPTHSPTHTADASARIVDVRSLSIEDARKERERAWLERNERDRNAWRQPARPVSMVRDFRTSHPASRPTQHDWRDGRDIRDIPLAELRARADKARAERDERDRNAWKTRLQGAENDLQEADDPIARAKAAERLRIATTTP